MDNQRKQIRINKFLTVGYHQLRGFLRSSGHSRDVSITGIRLASFQRFEPKTVLKLQINLRDDFKPVEAVGEVVWLKDTKDRSFPYDIGLKFIKINAGASKKIGDYIKEIIENEGIRA